MEKQWGEPFDKCFSLQQKKDLSQIHSGMWPFRRPAIWWVSVCTLLGVSGCVLSTYFVKCVYINVILHSENMDYFCHWYNIFAFSIMSSSIWRAILNFLNVCATKYIILPTSFFLDLEIAFLYILSSQLPSVFLPLFFSSCGLLDFPFTYQRQELISSLPLMFLSFCSLSEGLLFLHPSVS